MPASMRSLNVRRNGSTWFFLTDHRLRRCPESDKIRLFIASGSSSRTPRRLEETYLFHLYGWLIQRSSFVEHTSFEQARCCNGQRFIYRNSRHVRRRG